MRDDEKKRKDLEDKYEDKYKIKRNMKLLQETVYWKSLV